MSTPLKRVYGYVAEFGSASEKVEGAMYWKRKLIYIIAKVPPKGIECKISFIAAKDTARIAARKK